MRVSSAILIVDDEEMNQVILQELLGNEYGVYLAANGQEALDALEQHADIQAVLLDVNMPVMNGLTALEHIRKTMGRKHLPVLICTQFDDEETRIKALDLGASDFFVKPYSVQVIKHRIDNLIKAGKLQQDLEKRSQTQQMRSIIDSIDAGIGLYEIDGDRMRVLYTNEAFYEMDGFDRESYKPFHEDALKALPKEAQTRVMRQLDENLKSGAPVDLCYTLRIKGKPPKYRHLRAMRIQYQGTENPVFLTCITDITQQQQVEHALSETSERYQALVDSVPGGIVTLRMGNPVTIVYYNDTLLSMLGYTRDEFDNKETIDPFDFVYPPDAALIDDQNQRFLRTGRGFTCTYRVLSKDGSIRWMLFSGAPMGHAGDGCPMLSGVLIDMTTEHLVQEQKAQALDEVKYRSEHDALTGLYNREYFYQQAEEWLKRNRNETAQIVIMDAARFRAFNDLFGKEAGDRALCAIARSLDAIVGGAGVYGRMEADHFAICLPKRSLDMDAIKRQAESELCKQGIDYRLTLKFGLYNVHSLKVSISQMCDRATLALTTIKGNVLLSAAYYDDALRKNMLEEQAILDEMNQALEQGQFIVYLQPLYSVSTHKPVSAEVLVRWNHPVKGMIPPGRFIPLFERNGFISKLDFVVWEEACRILQGQKARGQALPLSVNISRIDLYNPRLCEDLLGLLGKYGVEPELMELEITESAYTHDSGEMTAVLKKLQDHGFHILMDDFGSGYSSLNALKDMPVDTLKIDMRFLHEMEKSVRAASIITSVVRMAKWLRIPVVAEGVETKNQLDFLRSIGCDNVQGYYFAKPMPESDFVSLMDGDTQSDSQPDKRLSEDEINAMWGDVRHLGNFFIEMVGCVGLYERNGDVLELQRVNDGYYQMMGVTPYDLSLEPHDMMKVVAKEDREPLLNALDQARETRQILQATVSRLIKDGSRIKVLCRIRYIADVGDSSLYCFVMNDVTKL